MDFRLWISTEKFMSSPGKIHEFSLGNYRSIFIALRAGEQGTGNREQGTENSSLLKGLLDLEMSAP